MSTPIFVAGDTVTWKDDVAGLTFLGVIVSIATSGNAPDVAKILLPYPQYGVGTQVELYVLVSRLHHNGLGVQAQSISVHIHRNTPGVLGDGPTRAPDDDTEKPADKGIDWAAHRKFMRGG